MTSAVGVSIDAERTTGAAFRRRQRRLRSWLRHERQSVATELAAALHHSRDARSEVAHVALRGQKTTSKWTRPEPPEEVSEPILAGGDATDDVTVAFLVAAALKEKKDEEEKARVRRQREAAEQEARMRELDRRVQNDVPLTPAGLMRWAGHLPPKKRKKRRKKTPRASFHPPLRRAHRRQMAVVRPWLVLLFWCFSRCIPFVCW